MTFGLIFLIAALVFLTVAGMISPSLIFLRNRLTVFMLMVPLAAVCALGLGFHFYQDLSFLSSIKEFVAGGSADDRARYCEFYDQRRELERDGSELATLSMLRTFEEGDEIFVMRRIKIYSEDELIIEAAREYDLKTKKEKKGALISIPKKTILEIVKIVSVDGKPGFELSSVDYGIDGTIALGKLEERVKRASTISESELAEQIDKFRQDLFPNYSADQLQTLANENGWDRYCKYRD